MTIVREQGDVLRAARPYGLGATRNRCLACNRFMPEGPEPACRSCGTIYQQVTDRDYQVVHLGQVPE
jgi:hypothetical protein